MLEGKNILVGVTGSIAAYKAVYLVRLLKQHGANVRVVMTKGAQEFVTPMTFATLSDYPVHSDFTENRESGEWTRHVDLALWADLFIAAPLTANTLSKMAHGQSDNFWTAVYMSVRCPVLVAPAMDHDMYEHHATSENLKLIQKFGHFIVNPGEGFLASGLSGKGRMAEPDEIVQSAMRIFSPESLWLDKKILITAGPTHEAIDPVRFIANRSSGKMGFALAKSFAKSGAQVTLVTGPTQEKFDHPLVKRIDVETAQEMFEACERVFQNIEIAIWSAAPADYRPATVAKEKLKKSELNMNILLAPNKDIAGELGKLKKQGQICVGFALETENELENAKSKLKKKNMDMIVLNSLRDEGAGFGHSTNKVTFITSAGEVIEGDLESKDSVAFNIMRQIETLIQK
jgi:phosphopantothenoylcysteine decarboxylase/phosphopantothenate--cysteine ligase